MPIELQLLKQIIECALLAAGEPLNLARLQQLFEPEECPAAEQWQQGLAELAEDCKKRGLLLKEVASGYCLQIQTDMQYWLRKLWEKRPPRYSRAVLETLALIAYRQPITRAEIEDIRGVAVSSEVIRKLMEREWIRIVGHRDVPGKPALYATTKPFLDYFNLKTLAELPPLTELNQLLTSANTPPETAVTSSENTELTVKIEPPPLLAPTSLTEELPTINVPIEEEIIT